MIRPPDAAVHRHYRVRIPGAWSRPDRYVLAMQWASTVGFDPAFCNSRTYLNGHIYVGYVSFELPEDALAFVLLFPELNPQPYDTVPV